MDIYDLLHIGVTYVEEYMTQHALRPGIAMILSFIVGMPVLILVYAAIKHVGVFTKNALMSMLSILWTVLFWIIFIGLAAKLGNYLTYDYFVNNEPLMSTMVEYCQAPAARIKTLLNQYVMHVPSLPAPPSPPSAPPPPVPKHRRKRDFI